MRIFSLLIVILLLCGLHASAQYDTRIKHIPKHKPTDSADYDDGDDDMDDEMDMSDQHRKMRSMPAALSLYQPMNRNGSGTSWLPDATPMYGYLQHYKEWMFLFHGDVFIRYNKQDLMNAGSRGGTKFDAPDMLMGMVQRKIGEKGLLHFNVMLSTDAIIAGGEGYPLLFQTGETWQGRPLVNRQHPHDLFSELSVSYAYAISDRADAYMYIGYPGEPALGPVTFMHRTSGMFGPDAPIGHHWQDATHITLGVATLGIRYGKFKLEGSSFTGREPDEHRYGFDKPLFNSFSGRVSYNPNNNWALQVSSGYIKSPEALTPHKDIFRNTASATCVYPMSRNKYFTASAVFGQNMFASQNPSNSALLEASLRVKKLAIYTRYEFVQKTGEDLNLPAIAYRLDKQFPIHALTVGGSYDLYHFKGITMAAGGQFAAYKADAALNGLYGKMPVSGELFLHFYPKLMN